MKPFDLEAAKRGDPIQTRDGRKARFVAHVPECAEYCRVLCFVEGETEVSDFCESGKYFPDDQCNLDLFMAPKKRVVWVNFYRDGADYFDHQCYANDHMCVRKDRIGNRAYPVEIDDE